MHSTFVNTYFLCVFRDLNRCYVLHTSYIKKNSAVSFTRVKQSEEDSLKAEMSGKNADWVNATA